MKHYFINLRDKPHKFYQLTSWLCENSIDFYVSFGIIGIPHMYGPKERAFIFYITYQIESNFEYADRKRITFPYSLPDFKELSDQGKILFA